MQVIQSPFWLLERKFEQLENELCSFGEELLIRGENEHAVLEGSHI